MLLKTPEFLDSMCVFCTLNANWRLLEVPEYGAFVFNENEPEKVYKVYNLDLWMEDKKFKKSDEVVNCPVRAIISNKAIIIPLLGQPIEFWINVIVSESLEVPIRVESYLDQVSALSDAESELYFNFEVHTKRVTVKVP